ncbi:MAG: hypothetical protein Q3971_05225 [Moraxella sp.]|nr:hypothetical protein [Moraxella sp.]
MTDITFTPNNFWHMQMHPTGLQDDFAPNIPYILEHRGFIGLGNWERDGKPDPQIAIFNERIAVNDIIAIRNGAKFIALVQVIGGAYHIKDDSDPDTHWIENRRPVRVLDWEIDGKQVRECPHYRPTLARCGSDDAETTQIIKTWYERVAKSLTARKLPLSL